MKTFRLFLLAEPKPGDMLRRRLGRKIPKPKPVVFVLPVSPENCARGHNMAEFAVIDVEVSDDYISDFC